MTTSAPPTSSDPAELHERYSRQILFVPIGEAGQRKLSESKIAIAGCGATGSAVAALLTRAGVGSIRIIDRDYVEPSNLQRQSLFDETDAAESMPKALAAARKLATFNSQVALHPEVADLTPENISTLFAEADLILDATDNFQTRYLINDFCIEHGLPWIYAAAVGSYCATMNILPGETACLACIFPDPPFAAESCDTVGILNAAVNLVASIQCAEALKFLVGSRELMRRSLFSWDLWKNERSEVAQGPPRADCRVCGQREFLYLRGKAMPQITLCGRNSVQIHEKKRMLNFVQLEKTLAPHGRVKHNEYVLKFWPRAYEMTLFPDGRAIIKGTTESAIARSLYARFIGS